MTPIGHTCTDGYCPACHAAGELQWRGRLLALVTLDAPTTYVRGELMRMIQLLDEEDMGAAS